MFRKTEMESGKCGLFGRIAAKILILNQFKKKTKFQSDSHLILLYFMCVLRSYRKYYVNTV